MFTRFARSWELMKASALVLQQDKELLVFPLCSAIAAVLVAATFVGPLLATGTLERLGQGQEPSAAVLAGAFLFYLSQYFVVFFFNTALVGAAKIRLEGGDPTVSDGLRIARARIGAIFGYAVIAATIGLILRMIEERAGFIGRWIAGLLGLAFTVATFLTVPILVSRDIGPIEAVKESASLLKKTWGENIIGNVGIGFVFGMFYLILGTLAFFVVFLGTQTGSAAFIFGALAVCVVAFVLLALIHAALQGVYAAALYAYAMDGEVGGAFSGNLLQDAFRPKK
jgi:hypothetical protein